MSPPRRTSSRHAEWSEPRWMPASDLFDTAEGYGRGLAERMLGQTLEELGCRDKAIIVAKVDNSSQKRKIDHPERATFSAEHVAERCELESLSDCVPIALTAIWPIGQTR